MSHPSVFPQGTIAKDKYYYAFYTVSKKDLNTIHMKLYDNNRTLVEEKSHKFSSINAVELLKKINNNGTNPLVIGHNTDASSNIDIAASNLYQQGWNNKQQDRLMRDINQDYGNVYNNVTETYDISYNGATYSLTQNGIDVSSTDLYVKPGLHVFDLNSLSRNNQSFLTFEPLTYGSTLPAIYNEGTLGSTYLYQTLRVDDFTPDMKFYIIPGQDLGRIYNNFTSAPARIFEVSVVNGVYYIDGIEKPKLFLFKDGNYVFLQTTADNTGNLLQFSSSSFENGLVVFNDGVLTKGVPGNQTYAYSAIEFSGDSSVYYYNYDVSNVDMGNRITRADFDVSLNVQVETNLQGQNVFAFYNVDLDTHIKQSVLPITYTADYNKVYYFDMSHISNSGEILTFGFNSDIDSGSTSAFDISYATHSLESPGSAGSFVALDLRDFYYEAVTARSVDYGLYDKSYSGVSFKVLFASGLPDGSGVFQVVDSQGGIISIQSPASTTLLYGKSEVDIVLAPNAPTGTYYIQDANNPSMDVLTIEHEYAYSVSVVNNVFHINSVPQAQISFVKNQTYKFIQSDSSNAGKLIVFGRNYDSATLYTIGVVHNGTPGQPGAYTELTLDNNFAGNLYYYSSAAPNMGYSPVSITTDTTTKSFNDTLAFHISNNIGTDVSYTITGVDASDLSGVSYTGNLTYGTIHTLNYIVRTVGKTAVMTAGAATTTITISDVNDAYKYTFGIQTSYYGQSVFATYDSVANVWYNQPNISFSAPNIYVIDLSSSIVNGGYHMVFGPTADDLGTLLSDLRVLRKPAENRIILDLDGYSGSVVYFEDSSGGMGYMNPSNTQYTYVVEALSNPYVYSVSGTPQQQIVFNPSTSYVFDQSDSTNIGQQLVFGRNYDDKTNLYTTNVRTIGTLGRPGAYTQIDLDPGFSGDLFYYSDASNNMGYAPLSLAVDGTFKMSGDNITYTVSNNTGADVQYTITGIATTDINNEPLTGNIPYGQTTTLTYTMTNTSAVNMIMTVGTESQTVNVGIILYNSNSSTTGKYITSSLDFSADFTFQVDFTPFATTTTNALLFGNPDSDKVHQDLAYNHFSIFYTPSQTIEIHTTGEHLTLSLNAILNQNNVLLITRTHSSSFAVSLNGVDDSSITYGASGQTPWLQNDFTYSIWCLGNYPYPNLYSNYPYTFSNGMIEKITKDSVQLYAAVSNYNNAIYLVNQELTFNGSDPDTKNYYSVSLANNITIAGTSNLRIRIVADIISGTYFVGIGPYATGTYTAGMYHNGSFNHLFGTSNPIDYRKGDEASPTGIGIFEIIRDVSRTAGDRTYVYDGTKEYGDSHKGWSNTENDSITMSKMTIGDADGTESGTPIIGKIYEFSIEYD